MLPVQKFLSFISDNQLFPAGSRVLLGVSGGKDSVLMAHLFNGAGITFGIAHCNFTLREAESDDDEIFTEELAKRFGAAFYSTRFETKKYAEEKKLSVQMAARELRYTWLEQVRVTFGYDFIALAHHLSDSTETVILNLTRGTGIQGLHGILPKRGRVIRPLLFLERAEIDGLAAINNIAYREDGSNASEKYARNKVRHKVIPVLKELNPDLDRTFAANSRRFAESEEFITGYVTSLRDKLFIPHGEDFHISIAPLKELHPQRLLLFELFRPFGFSEEVLADLASALDKHPGRTFYSAGHRIVLDRKVLVLGKLNDISISSATISADDVSVNWGAYNFRISRQAAEKSPVARNQQTAVLDAEKLVYPLTIRSWNGGDFFYPLGMTGKKKLSDFYTSLKIPVNEKARIPVFENGNGEIAWIAGYRISDRYKVGPQTKKVVIFEIA
jgi:tRNA(Ile)-lysidine synthase